MFIVIGSESDLPVMRKAADTLKSFEIPHHLTVASAHRSPRYLVRLVKEAEHRGAEVFIAGAGGAAHLAGTVAAHTVRPVIGVPISSRLLGLDSLLSTVQMPSGVPVATVAVDGAVNAAVLAAQILAVKAPALRARLNRFKEDMAKGAESKRGKAWFGKEKTY